LRISIIKILDKNQIIAAFLKRALGDIIKAKLIPHTFFLETFSNVGGNGSSRTSNLGFQTIFLTFGEVSENLYT